MGAAPLPPDEKTRLEYLEALSVLDTAPNPAFDRFVELARLITGAPVALVSLVDADRQWFKARAGFEGEQTPREQAFCAHAILQDTVMVVPDASADPRFADNPLVLSGPEIRFYAGAPLITKGGNLGTLCVLGPEPRTLEDDQRQALAMVAAAVVEQMEQRVVNRRARRHIRWLHLAEELGKVGHWRLVPREQQLFWSPEVYAIHGRDPEAFEPDLANAIDAYHPEDRDEVARVVRAALERGEPFDFELRIIRPDGGVRWVRASGRPETEPETGEVTSIFGVFQDVTEQMLMRSELLHTETLSSLGLMAATMAHEINNPLASMKLNAEALGEVFEGTLDPEHGRLALSDLDDAIERIRQLTGELQAVARPSGVETSAVDLQRAVDAALRLVGFRLGDVPTDVALGEGHLVHANEAQLVQVLMNLLINAHDALEEVTSTDRRITIRSDVEGENVCLRVSDSGSGMGPETIARAFEPFYTTKRSDQGTGLGLYVCRNIVQSFGGTVTVASTAGRGTTVRIELPRASPEERVSPVPSAPGRARAESRLLIIDDNAMLARALGRVFRDAEVTTDPQQGLERLLRQEERFGAIICDISMPGLSGPELYERAVAEWPELEPRFLFITGGTPQGRTAEFVEAQGHRTFIKPLDLSALQAAVDSLM